jgi:hypothetical protein
MSYPCSIQPTASGIVGGNVAVIRDFQFMRRLIAQAAVAAGVAEARRALGPRFRMQAMRRADGAIVQQHLRDRRPTRRVIQH